MTTMDARPGNSAGAPADDKKPLWAKYHHGHHWRSASEEFDACKLGFWLFLATEVLLFAGIFVAYAIFRAKYPGAWTEGSSQLNWQVGGLNTVVLLISSFTMAYAIYCFQTDKQRRARINLLITLACGVAFLAIKFFLEYLPKWSGWFLAFDPAVAHYETSGTGLGGLFVFVEGYGGKRPGSLFDSPFAIDLNMPLWWAVYYSGTALHALHVIIGMALIYRVYIRSFKGHYGPKHYTMVEMSGLYWHLVDLVWIFLFPLLYLIH